ncbi:MAG TPA: hypothetical protein VNN21_10380 [Dehalococcoidia bacterium]|nr:hypothetical protein [Dehalococcoidia bacterium]
MIATVDAGPLYAAVDADDDDHAKCVAVLERADDLPLGGTDASVAALADRLRTDVVVTLDRRHFGVLRTREGASFRLLPD